VVFRAGGVRAWRLLDEPFNEAAGHVTPTLKLKRAVITSDFADEIDKLYTS
jgi:long-chain acyl-CoA synthetase